jgi:hypothetical protein
MTTTWTIAQCDRFTSDGFVTTVHWRASQVDGTFSSSTYSTVCFTKEEGINYVPYENLTEADVIEWVKGSLGDEGVAAVDAALTAQIVYQQAPKIASGTPW